MCTSRSASSLCSRCSSLFLDIKDLEESSKKLYKEVKKYEECLTSLQRQEEKVSWSDT